MFTRRHLIALQLMLLIALVSACGAPALTDAAPTTRVPTLRAPSATATPLPKSSPTVTAFPTATTAQPGAPPLSQVRGVQWSQTSRGLTVGLFFEPYPPDLAGSTTYKVVVADTNGQLITDATVELSVIAGMAGMEGEHDDTFEFRLEHQGNGVYSIQSSVSGTNQALTRILITVKRGGQVWSFPISKDELPPP